MKHRNTATTNDYHENTIVRQEAERLIDELCADEKSVKEVTDKWKAEKIDFFEAMGLLGDIESVASRDLYDNCDDHIGQA